MTAIFGLAAAIPSWYTMLKKERTEEQDISSQNKQLYKVKEQLQEQEKKIILLEKRLSGNK